MGIDAALIPGLDREEPDFWIEDDIPTPDTDAQEERERGRATDDRLQREPSGDKPQG